MPQASGKSFLEFVQRFSNPLEANANARNPERWKSTSTGVYVYREGTPREKTYDFNEFFPAEGRDKVDRLEGFLFAVYEHRGGTGEFTPYPAPTVDEDDEE